MLPSTEQLSTHTSKKSHLLLCDKTTAGWLDSSWLLYKAKLERVERIQIRVQGKGGRTEKQYVLKMISFAARDIKKSKVSERNRSPRMKSGVKTKSWLNNF